MLMPYQTHGQEARVAIAAMEVVMAVQSRPLIMIRTGPLANAHSWRLEAHRPTHKGVDM